MSLQRLPVFREVASARPMFAVYHVDVGIVRDLFGRARADFQQTYNPLGAIDDVMTIAGACLEAGRHSRRETRLAFVRHQYGLTVENVHEFILVLVPMTLGRPGAGRQLQEIDPELRHSKDVTQPTAAAFATRHVVRRRIVRSDARRQVRHPNRGRCCWHGPNLPVIRWCHSTAHLGGRFSAKARRPSAASGLRRASANLSAAKSSTAESGSVPTFMTTALVAALAKGAQRSICLSTSSSLPSSAALSLTIWCAIPNRYAS